MDLKNVESKQNDKQFTSTNKADVPADPLKPESEKNQQEQGDPYPQDSTEEALFIQKQFKLSKTNMAHTALGQTKARPIYQQKKTRKLYFGDGTPYTGFPASIGPDLSFVTKQDVVANPFTPNIDNIA
jgi:hypothetical protein